MNSQATITPDMTMGEIMEKFPAAQRALFQRYHIGGCSSCGFQPTDTLGQLCKDHNILDVNELIQHVHRAQELDEKMWVDATEVKGWLDEGRDFSFLDVRMPEELGEGLVDGAEPLDYGNQDRYMCLAKDRLIVFLCKDGGRSLDVAAYFAGHAFSNVKCVRRGLEGWRESVGRHLSTP